MSSTLAQILTAYGQALETVFVGHKRLPRPEVEKLEQNSEMHLAKGYGYRFGDGINSNRQLACGVSVQRSLYFVNTLAHRGTDLDIPFYTQAAIDLLSYQHAALKAIEEDATLQGHCAVIKYLSDTGVNHVYSEKTNYLFIETNLMVEYFDNF